MSLGMIDFGDLAKGGSVFDGMSSVVREEITRFMLGATSHLEAEVVDRTPTGAHQLLRRSIRSDVYESGGMLLGVVGSPLDYAESVELGTKPHWAPVQPLVEWAYLKLGLPPGEAEAAGKRIQYAIAHRGTLGVGMFHRALVANAGELERQAMLTAKRIEDRMGEVKP